MRHLVIGLGEVGSALREILDAEGLDPYKGIAPAKEESCKYMHVCIPYDENFNRSVKEYKERFKPLFTTIHSTVPVGTSRTHSASHSPIRGKHPNLKESILTFTKYVGGTNAGLVAAELETFGIPARAVERSEETEAGKLLDLMQFGAMVLLEKEIHAYCHANGLNAATVYRDFNTTYNEGYQKLGFPEFTRPILKHMDGKIGGHCVSQMMNLLQCKSARNILDENERL